jgi:hypothetical protein
MFVLSLELAHRHRPDLHHLGSVDRQRSLPARQWLLASLLPVSEVR